MMQRQRPEDITEPIPLTAIGGGRSSGQRERPPEGARIAGSVPSWLKRSIVLVALLVLLVGVADLGIVLAKHSTSADGAAGSRSHAASSGPRSSAAPTKGAAPTHRARHSSGRPASAPAASSRPHHRKRPAPAPAAGPGAPRLTSVSPATTTGGAVVVVRGTNLSSPNGIVLARVDGQATRTDCSTLSSCQVTVPQFGSTARTLEVTITTAAGTSNPVRLAYR